MTHRCLNSYYRALQNETVTSRSLRLQTAELACSLIPAALQNEPVFLSVDDTTVPKFVERVLQYPHLAFICNVRSDSAIYELPPLPSGKPGRPKKRGKRIHLDDFTLSWNMDGMKFGHRIVLTHICGNRRIHAYVSCTASGSRQLFFSTLDPSTLHMSCAWQERKILRDAGMDYYPLKQLTCLRQEPCPRRLYWHSEPLSYILNRCRSIFIFDGLFVVIKLHVAIFICLIDLDVVAKI